MELKKLTDEKWLNLYTINNWLFTSRKDLTVENFSERSAVVDAIVIVPINIDNNKIILIEEFREPLQKYEMSFPAGLVEAGENIEDAVKRELFEETGLQLKNILLVSPRLYSSSGLTDESIKIVWVECEGEISLEYKDKDEKINDIIELPAKDIKDFFDNIEKSPQHEIGAKTYLVLMMLYVLGLYDLDI